MKSAEEPLVSVIIMRSLFASVLPYNRNESAVAVRMSLTSAARSLSLAASDAASYSVILCADCGPRTGGGRCLFNSLGRVNSSLDQSSRNVLRYLLLGTCFRISRACIFVCQLIGEPPALAE